MQADESAFGNHFRVKTYGESRRDGVGCLIDGAPPRRPLSEADLQADLNRIGRRPGQISRITNTRNETDTCKILSAVHEGLTTGTPIHVFAPNTGRTGRGYHEILVAYRPSHVDLTFDMKYGIRSCSG